MVIHRLLSKGDPAFCEEFLTFTVLYKECKFLSCHTSRIIPSQLVYILFSAYFILDLQSYSSWLFFVFKMPTRGCQI